MLPWRAAARDAAVNPGKPMVVHAKPANGRLRARGNVGAGASGSPDVSFRTKEADGGFIFFRVTALVLPHVNVERVVQR
jgi:hypothetical protein